MSTRHRSIVAALAAVAGTAAGASAQLHEVLYSKAAGHATAVIPGAMDANGNPVFAEFRAMENLYGSQDGTRWLLKGRTQLGSDLETMLMLGSGATGSVLIQEGQPALGGGWYDFIGSDVGRFDDAGNFAFSVRCRTGATGSTSAPDGHRVLKRTTSGTLTLEFKQLDPYTGLADPNGAGNESVGNSVGSIHLLNDGSIGCQDSTINNIHTSRRPAIFYELARFHQSNETSVNAMGGLGARTWSTIDANGFFTTPSGDHWMASGGLNGPSGALVVLVRDGSAVLQQNEPVAGSTMLMGDVFQYALASSGHWFARGRDNSGTAASAPDWAVLNGALVARTGDPIFTGSSEVWGDTFSTLAVDSQGNWVLAGNVAGANPASDFVMVYNGTTVILREGDRVDLNGNGQADDDAYVGRGNNTLAPFLANNAIFLSTDGHLYALVNLRNEAGADLNSSPVFGTPNALIRVRLPQGGTCDADVNCDGAVNGTDVEVQELAVGGVLDDYCQADADFNQDGAVNGTDVEAVELVVGGGPCP